jgi:hypothetical protein
MALNSGTPDARIGGASCVCDDTFEFVTCVAHRPAYFGSWLRVRTRYRPPLADRLSLRCLSGMRGAGRLPAAAMSLVILVSIGGCHTTAETVGLTVGAATVVGGRSVGSEIEQTYYLGVFDPQDQLPPQVYRLRVHGQGSFIGLTKFASGWVPAALADSLGSTISFSSTTSGSNPEALQLTSAGSDQSVKLAAGRRLVMFGPEGFREAPADQRLVIVMGTNPSGYFNGIDNALGKLSAQSAQKKATQNADQLSHELLQDLVSLDAERAKLDALTSEVDKSLPSAQ